MSAWPLLALLLALIGLFATDSVAVERGLVAGAVERDLVRIADLAALRGEAGSAGATASMPVMVTQDGGPGWLTDAAEAAVEADPIFERGQPHLLQVEVIRSGQTFGLRCQLWRQGWSLRAPEPLWVTPAAWIPWMTALVVLGIATVRRRFALAIVVAGGLAQLLLLALPWPADHVRPSFSASLEQGPLGHWVVELARTMPDSSVAIGAGVVTLCVLLMVFDHRRSPGQGGDTVLAGTLGVLGGLAWLEASLRAGLWPWMTTVGGWIALAGIALLTVWAWRRRERAATATEIR